MSGIGSPGRDGSARGPRASRVDETVPHLNRRVQVVTAPQNDNGGEEPEPAPDSVAPS